MIISRVSVQRPVFAIMISAAIIVVGWFSYRQLGLDLMPKTEAAVVNVNVSLPGASAEEVETQLTKPLEEAVNTINGIDELRASSDPGRANLNISFVLERDIEAATQDVRDKVAAAVRNFPKDTCAAGRHKSRSGRRARPHARRIRAAHPEGAHRHRRQAGEADPRDRRGRRRNHVHRRSAS
jgi:multidrug efflux pump subunit AcrB